MQFPCHDVIVTSWQSKHPSKEWEQFQDTCVMCFILRRRKQVILYSAYHSVHIITRSSPSALTSAAPNLKNEKESSQAWNSLPSNVPCSMPIISWKLHENPSSCFSAMLLTDTPTDKPTEVNTLLSPFGGGNIFSCEHVTKFSANANSGTELYPSVIHMLLVIFCRNSNLDSPIFIFVACDHLQLASTVTRAQLATNVSYRENPTYKLTTRISLWRLSGWWLCFQATRREVWVVLLLIIYGFNVGISW